MDEDKSNEQPTRRSLEKMSYAEKGRFFRVRNVLNIAFIILAIAGMALYFYNNKYIGGALLILGMALKVIECVLRLIH